MACSSNWWTAADRKNFDARTTRWRSSMTRMQPLPGLHINGQLTLGENIADLAGLEIALKAYHLALDGKPAPVMDGFTGDQRFYIAYAQSWREVWRDRPHPADRAVQSAQPAQFRVNGVVRNSDEWYAAFPQIKPGDTYYLAPDDARAALVAIYAFSFSVWRALTACALRAQSASSSGIVIKPFGNGVIGPWRCACRLCVKSKGLQPSATKAGRVASSVLR